MKPYAWVLVLFVFYAGFPGISRASERLVIEGTGDSQVVLRKLARSYEAAHPDVQVVVPDSVGSGGGIKALLKGTSGLARTARSLKPSEAQKGLVQVAVARSPIVFAAHPVVSHLKNITIDQVIRIYEGELANWHDLGGEDHKLYPIDREEGDSSRKSIDHYLTGVLKRSEGIRSAGKVFYTTPEAVQAIAKNAYTIGYVPFSIALAENLHIFSLNSIFPDENSIREKQYPLVTTFYLVKPRAPGKEALAFLAFVKSKPAKDLMISSGVFPVDDRD